MIAATEHHQILLENDRVGMLEIRLGSGDSIRCDDATLTETCFLTREAWVQGQPKARRKLDVRSTEAVLVQFEDCESRDLHPPTISFGSIVIVRRGGSVELVASQRPVSARSGHRRHQISRPLPDAQKRPA